MSSTGVSRGFAGCARFGIVCIPATQAVCAWMEPKCLRRSCAQGTASSWHANRLHRGKAEIMGCNLAPAPGKKPSSNATRVDVRMKFSDDSRPHAAVSIPRYPAAGVLSCRPLCAHAHWFGCLPHAATLMATSRESCSCNLMSAAHRIAAAQSAAVSDATARLHAGRQLFSLQLIRFESHVSGQQPILQCWRQYQ